MKHFKLFEKFVNEDLLNEGALTGKQEKELKKLGWNYSKQADKGTVDELMPEFGAYLKKRPTMTEDNAGAIWMIAHDDNTSSWEMWTLNDSKHGLIKIVSYTNSENLPYNNKKNATCCVNIADIWYVSVQGYKDVIKDVIDMFVNPNKFESSTDKIIGGMKYYGMESV